MGMGEQWADQLRYHQAQIRSFELSHPNIYPMDKLPKQVKEPVLQIQNYRISMTQDNTGYERGVSVRCQY